MIGIAINIFEIGDYPLWVVTALFGVVANLFFGKPAQPQGQEILLT